MSNVVILRNEVRDGLPLALSIIAKNLKLKNGDLMEVWNNFVKAVDYAIKSAGLNPRFVDLDHIIKERKKLVDPALPVISLDKYDVSYPILNVSRIFTDQGQSYLGIGHSPGYLNLDQQIMSLPKQKIQLVEDDCFTGSTILEITKKLDEYGIDVERVVVGSLVSNKRVTQLPIVAVDIYDPKDVIDIIDPRDFFIGSLHGGLAERHKCQTFRVPYIKPFVNITTRINIPHKHSAQFSQLIYKANIEAYNQIAKITGRPILLSDIAPHFHLALKTISVLRSYNSDLHDILRLIIQSF